MKFQDTFIGRPNTIATYRSLFKHHIEPLKIEHLATIWKEEFTNTIMMKWEREKGLSRRTRTMLLRILRNYIIFLGGPTIETKSLTRMMTRSEQQKEVLVLNKEQARLLMETTLQLDRRFYPILLLGLHGGLRRGEVFGLRCGDIDMFKNRIRIAHSHNGPTKNGKTRYIPMSTELENAMIAARNLLMRPTDTKIFECMDPNPRLRRLLKAANLPKLRFHDLRHSFATMALESGVSARIVANWLGHSSVTTTLSIYWNLTGDETNLDFLP